MGYNALILLPSDTDVSIDDVRRKLESYFTNDKRDVSFTADKDRLTLTIDGWDLYVDLNRSSSVRNESKEIANLFAAQRPDKAEIAASGVRLEISSDDDEEMDYFNDYMDVLDGLGEFRGAKVWESASEKFLD